MIAAADRVVSILHRAHAALSTLRDVANRDVLTPEDVDVDALESLRADIEALTAALEGSA
jgi:hypothetical protein